MCLTGALPNSFRRNRPHHTAPCQVSTATALNAAFGFTAMEDPRLITRHVTRNVYDAVFNDVTFGVGGAKCLVEGASGIGKSRNLTYLLKKLLEANRIVLYHAAKLEEIYSFIPTQGTYMKNDITNFKRYRCYEAAEKDFQRVLFNNNNLINKRKDVVYLYDPPQGEGEPRPMNCSAVIAASPNVRHFREFIRQPHCEYKINMFSIGGSIRVLTNWHAVMKAIGLRNEAIQDITDFSHFNLYKPSKRIASLSTTVNLYTSSLCTYHNDRNPDAMSYGEYIYGLTVRIISPGALQAICQEKYSLMYKRMQSMREVGTAAAASEAGYYFELIAKTFLAIYGSFTVRDLERVAFYTRKKDKQNQTLMRLAIGKGQLASASALADLLATIPGLPAPETNGILLWAAEEKVKDGVSGAKRNRAEFEMSADIPIVRTLHHSSTCDKAVYVDAADAPRRGYQLHIRAGDRHIHYTAMHDLLVATNCDADHPYDLFLLVPEDTFDEWVHKQTLVKEDGTPLTEEQIHEIDTTVHQYVLRVPSSL